MGELIRRDTPPRPETVLRLATALRCEPSDLDPRLANESMPVPGSRVAMAAEILARKFKFRVEFIRTTASHYMVCRRPDDPPDAIPTAIVAGPNSDGEWGCLAESKLQLRVFEALNGHA